MSAFQESHPWEKRIDTAMSRRVERDAYVWGVTSGLGGNEETGTLLGGGCIRAHVGAAAWTETVYTNSSVGVAGEGGRRGGG